MNKGTLILAHSLLFCILILIVGASVLCAEPSSREIIAKVEKSYGRLDDMRAELHVAYTNQDELKKIGEDFARSFGFKKIAIAYKAPDKMRYESSHISYAKVVVITAGFRKSVGIPSLHLHKRMNIDPGDLGKKQYPVDFGIASGDMWVDWTASYQGIDSVDGHSCYVLKLVNDKSKKRESHMKIWIDRSLWVPRRLDKVRYEGDLKSSTLYKDFKLVNGKAMVPYRIEIHSPSGKLAGVLEYDKANININIPDSDFKI